MLRGYAQAIAQAIAQAVELSSNQLVWKFELSRPDAP
jgi:hypothetical protein